MATLLSTQDHNVNRSATCSVGGAESEKDLISGGICCFGSTAIDNPAPCGGSSTARFLVLTKMKESTTRSVRKRR